MKNILWLAVIALTLGGCLEKTDVTALNGTQWKLSEWVGKTLPADGEATLNINGMQVGGKAFCNGYGGNIVVEGGKVRAKEIMSTKMFCEKLSEFETAYLKILETPHDLKMDGDKLVIANGSTRLLVFEKLSK